MIDLTKEELAFLMEDLELDLGDIEDFEVKTTIRTILKKLRAEFVAKRCIPGNDQRSTTDQLQDLVRLADKNGLYDASDWIKNKLEVR